MEEVTKQQNLKHSEQNEWTENPSGEREMRVIPIKVNDTDHEHKWEYVFTDGEGVKNFRCTHPNCMHGRRGND